MHYHGLRGVLKELPNCVKSSHHGQRLPFMWTMHKVSFSKNSELTTIIQTSFTLPFVHSSNKGNITNSSKPVEVLGVRFKWLPV